MLLLYISLCVIQPRPQDPIIGGIPPYPMTSTQSIRNGLYKRRLYDLSSSHSTLTLPLILLDTQFTVCLLASMWDTSRTPSSSLNHMAYGGSSPPINYEAQLSLLSAVKDPRKVDNRWDMLPIELRQMIVNMINKPHEEAQRRYWKVRYARVIAQVLSKVRCRNCGDAKIAGLYTIRLGEGSSLICPMYARHTLGMSDAEMRQLLTNGWNDLMKRNTRLWK